MSSELPRIMVVDDEEAILETMTFTFMDTYDVHTSTDARQALEVIDSEGPFALVITDQRMPNMTGVEFLKEVFGRHPETVRIMLTGFSDAEATIEAINDGHVYAYIRKPWEPDELKQIVRRAVELHGLSAENQRLVGDLRRSKYFLEAVMDRLETGALAMNAEGRVQAANKPARRYLKLDDTDDAGLGMTIDEVLARQGLEKLGESVRAVSQENGGQYEDAELQIEGTAHRLRISGDQLVDPAGELLGRVVLFKEVSHEPLRRSFDEIVAEISACEVDLRAQLDEALNKLGALSDEVRQTGVSSASMANLHERVSRAQTAIQSWLDVDDVMSREDFPDAQLLMDRLRVAAQRWPDPDSLPAQVQDLARSVEDYYESGEHAKRRILS